MESGLLIRWGASRLGREKESLAIFDETVSFLKGLVDAGRLAYFEPFMFNGGDVETESGFFLIKGQVDQIFALMEDPTYRSLMNRAVLSIEHVHTQLVAVGEHVKNRLEGYREAIEKVGV